MEQQDPPLIHSCRIQNEPHLPLETTPCHCQKHKRMQTTKSGNSRTTSDPPP